MKKRSFEVARGVRDWSGAEAILRNKVRSALLQVFERYGYNPLETPVFETTEALGFKGGGEIQKEVFRLTDRRGHQVGLRFDHTVPLARYIATNRNLRFPFKRYAVGEVFRDGPAKVEQGRYRTFTQCDVDVVGVPGMSAEAELFALARDAFDEIGLGGVKVKINNRKLLDGILSYVGVPQTSKLKTIVALDKRDKIGIDGVKDELSAMRTYEPPLILSRGIVKDLMNIYNEDSAIPDKLQERVSQEIREGLVEVKQILESSPTASEAERRLHLYENRGNLALEKETVDHLLQMTSLAGGNEDTYRVLSRSLGHNEGLQEISQLLEYARKMSLDFIEFDPALARGLDYYTGTTIEVFLKNTDILKSAILAGGRYDDMVGDFRGDDERIPAVGFSFGLERVVQVLKSSIDMGDIPQNMTQLYLIPMDTLDETLRIAQKLRHQGLNVDVHHDSYKKVGDVIYHADQVGIGHVGFVGEDELKADSVTIKNLRSGNQQLVQVNEVGMYFSRSEE